MALFDAQVASRHLDLAARWLRGRGQGYYTIGSAGHEAQRRGGRGAAPHRPGAAALPLGRRSTCARAAQVPGHDAASATCCSGWWRPPTSRSPAGGTRCSATTTWPSSRRPPPSRRTCRARSGVAFAHRPGRASSACASPWPADAIVVCSFGDASANHSTATGAINTAVPRRLPAPAAAAAVRLRGQRHRHQRAHAARLDRARPTATAPGLRYVRRPTAPTRPASFDAAAELADWVRAERAPGVPAPAHRALHGGHAGTDVEAGLPQPGRDPRRLRARPDPRHAPGCSSDAGVPTPGRAGRPLRARSRAEVLALAERVPPTQPQLDHAPRR